MKVYLDVSCLNRPFDDQTQSRVHLESEAVLMVLRRVESGEWRHVSGEIAVTEVDATSDAERRKRLRQMLPPTADIMPVSAALAGRAGELTRFGFKAADALHAAAAEAQQADVLLSCDDQFCRVAAGHAGKLRVRVVNPVDWLKEAGDADDA